MTGLDISKDALVEVAAVVTDAELNVLGEPVSVVITTTPAHLEQMEDVVRQMHTDSGLLTEIPSGLTMADAEAAILAYLQEWVPEGGRLPLAGNSMGMDRAFLARDMPAVSALLHYRSIDVSSVKELARRWYPRIYFNAPAKTGNHRALGDILDSIYELRYYRAAMMAPDPGPTSAEAQEVAAQITAERRAAETPQASAHAAAGREAPESETSAS